MRLTRQPHAVIFDLDGVLLDTEPLYTEAAQRVVARHGKHYDWSIKSRTMGTDALAGARYTVDVLDLAITPEQYVAARNVELQKLFQHTPAMPGAQAWVDALCRVHLPLAIATNSYSDLCRLKWRGNEWLNAINIVLHGDHPSIKQLKPAPDIYLEAARQLSISPRDCLVFEDSPAGVAAARAAGMQVIALKAKPLPLDSVSDADLVIESWDEVDLSTLLWA
jgi:pseudouridine 5'-phosphatase